MKGTWPPNTSSGPARLLQAIDWDLGVQWVYSTTTVINFGWLSYFKIHFANDCPQQAYITLQIEATGPMWIYVNGVYSYFGAGSVTELTFPVNCGANVIEVYVYNYCCYRGGIRFEILQN